MVRDGFVSWEGSRYGVHWKWVGRIVQVGQRLGTVEIWAGDELIAVHPQGQLAGQHFILPGQWAGLPRSLAGKPLAGFRATPDRRIIVLCDMIVSVIRFKHPLLHRQSSLRKRRLGENRGFRPGF